MWHNQNLVKSLLSSSFSGISQQFYKRVKLWDANYFLRLPEILTEYHLQCPKQVFLSNISLVERHYNKINSIKKVFIAIVSEGKKLNIVWDAKLASFSLDFEI